MKKINVIVASKNAAKIGAVSKVLSELKIDAELISIETDSGVSAQPRTISETRKGAVNRARNARLEDSDFAIGLEGGVFELDGQMYLCNWGALAAKGGKVYTAAGAQIPLPEEIANQLRNGRELGPVMDHYANETEIRHHKGAVGILTDGLINRDEMFVHVVKLLMGQHKLDSD